MDPFNFTVVPNIVLGVEVSTMGEEIIVEEELVASDILVSYVKYQKSASCRVNSQ